MATVPTLGYYNLRGLAQPIRNLLTYVQVQFNDKRYDYTNRDDWLAEKFNLGFDFPNTPYYIDGDVKLTQSMAILKYLGRKHGLVATDEKNLVRQDLVAEQLRDMKNGLSTILRSDEFEERKPKYISETLVPQLELLSKFLGSNEWFAGKLTYVDFLVYELLYFLSFFSPDSIDKFPKLRQYLNRFESLPSLKSYLNSDEYKNTPFNPHMKLNHSQGTIEFLN